jgi:hypothetical protein
VGVLSSPRRRRRLIGWGGAALVLAAIAFSMVHWSNTGTKYDIAADPTEPAPPPAAPRPARFTPGVREAVLDTAARFVRTAVVREHVADSWELTAPSLKAGYTREAWATGDIPVPPYPVDVARWDVDYSWEGVVGLKVALFPKRGEEVPAAVFDMQLRAFGKGKDRRWLVDSWTPTSYTGVPNGPLLGGSNRPPVETKSALGASWLFLPLGILSLALAVPLFVLARGWWRDRRAARRYEASLH